jgi:uncharacterized protein YpmB
MNTSYENDTIVWKPEFNPLEWVMELYCQANENESGRAQREVMFDEPISKVSLYNYRVVWHYFQIKVNSEDKRQLMILVHSDKSKIIGFADKSGISDEFYEQYRKLE